MKKIPLLYLFGKYSILTFAKIVFGYKVNNRNHVPPKGPFILASNHISYYDPPLVGCATSRICNFMAKKELFGNKIVGWVLRRVLAIPIDRTGFGGDTIKRVLRILKSNGGLVMFPEGTRSAKGEMREMKIGVGLLALRSGAVVVPTFIQNSENALKNRLTGKKVIVTFAEPIRPEEFSNFPPGKEGYKALTDEVNRRIKILKDKQVNSNPVKTNV
ncbi:MAG: 1-acyl-sn-glycerol-3-phosphate acyltransferase [candidate division Zixibacteria bacterium]|nr:1-acyl-sn-glycerol-3-phosphate acyltransferase [candidate division Zixibacteria bacterium]